MCVSVQFSRMSGWVGKDRQPFGRLTTLGGNVFYGGRELCFLVSSQTRSPVVSVFGVHTETLSFSQLVAVLVTLGPLFHASELADN
jgi:hypothetical protein